MKTIIALLIFVASFGARADVACASLKPEGSSLQVGCLAAHELAVADKALNESYQALLIGLPVENRDKNRGLLVQAQRAWIKFRDSNCAFVGELNGGHPAWNSVRETQCKAKLTTQRANEIGQMERQ